MVKNTWKNGAVGKILSSTSGWTQNIPFYKILGFLVKNVGFAQG